MVKDAVKVHVDLTSHFPARVTFEKLELHFEPEQYNQTFFAADKVTLV